MSTQQYYPPPSNYVPRPQAGQRQTMQYNPAGYNPAAYHPQAPPSPPAMNAPPQPAQYNPNVYIPSHPVGPPGRMTPQPVVGAGGYVPYANLQGVIGGVNRSAALESSGGGEEAPPPYSPPQRPFNRQMQPPNLQVPVNVQNNMYTPITPSNSYQPHPQIAAPQPPAQQPPAPGYPVQDQRRIPSQPGAYHPSQVPPAPPVQAQQAPQNPQYNLQRQPTASQSQGFAPPAAPPSRSPDDVEPSSPRNATLPAIGAARERDTLPLRRSTAPGNTEPTVPNRRATMPIPPPPPSIPPPPSGPPPGGAMPMAVRRQTMDAIPNPVPPAQVTPGPPTGPPTQTPTTGQAQLPAGLPLPPPPNRPPPKTVLLGPAPLGKKRDKGKGISRNGESSTGHDDASDRALASPPPSAPYSAGTLPFRRNSPPNSGTTPHTSGFPSATIQPQSIMRSQKSSGDLASGGLRTTTPKDVRFVIPDDESEYESTADGDSQRNSAVEPSPAFAAAAAPTTPRTPGTPGRPRVSSQQVTSFATIAEEDGIPDGASSGKASASGWPNEKESLGLKNIPTSAPPGELRFNTTQTPPFSPESQKAEKSASINGQVNGAKTQAITPPMNSAPLNSKGDGSAKVFPEDEPEDLDLPPFYHEAIERHTDMILTEATAPNDEKRLNVFVDFVLEEARMRGELYNSALGILGPGLSIFPSDDPEHMTPEQQVAEFERREYEKRVLSQLASGSAANAAAAAAAAAAAGAAAGGSSLKRRQTIKEQKARAGEFLESRRSRSNPSTPREPKRASWFEDGPSESAGGSPKETTEAESPEIKSPPAPEPALIDVQPLMAIAPPYPRQFPAGENSHPTLQKTRKAIAELKDLRAIQKLKFDFTTSVPRIQDENAAEARARKAAHQDYIQRLFSEGRVTYEEMDRLTAEFERKEGEKKAEALQNEFERFQKEVVSPSHAELMDRIDKATSIMDGIQTDISASAKGSVGIREGPELLEKLNIMRSLFETRENLYGEINNLIADRDSRYKEVEIAPFLNEGDTEGIKEAEEFYAGEAKKAKVTADKEALDRAKSFLDKVERDVITGVESEVSNFWDVAPTLTELLDKIPSDLSNVKPVIPEDESYGNPNYAKFPLLYLKKKLDYVGNSIYQHAQAQMRLLDFSVEITLLWTNAKWALGDSERVLAGEEEQRAVWQVERQKREEEVRQTKNWEEKVKIVKEEWSQSVGNRLSEMKKRIIDQLSQQEGWSNEYL